MAVISAQKSRIKKFQVGASSKAFISDKENQDLKNEVLKIYFVFKSQEI